MSDSDDGRSDGRSGNGADDGARYRTFRGRFTTGVAWITGVALTVGCVFVALMATGPGAQSTVNRVSIIAAGLFFSALTLRFAALRAVPDPDGLTVVNYVRRRRLEWAEIVGLRFGYGDPWAYLDLADGTVLAVMAVQRSDGEHGMREAGRLASLIAERGEAPDPGPRHDG